MSSLTPTLIIDEYAHVKKKREFFSNGKILVSLHQKVTASTPVATFEEKGELHYIRISEKHSLSPEDFLSGLLVSEGENVSHGTKIFCKKSLFGLLSIEELSPYEGVVEVISGITGSLGIRLKSSYKNLLSYLSGTVIGITEDSVTIEATAGMIQGVFGIGGERTGTLRRLSIADEKHVEISDLPEDCNHMILVGGTQPSGEVLLEAQRRGAVGFITAGISDSALRGFLSYEIGLAITGNEPCTMSVMVTDGFGDLKFSKKVSDLFTAYSGTTASMNGTTQVRAGALRPEVLIFHDKKAPDNVVHNIEKDLALGVKIRGTRAPFFGKEGIIIELPVELERLPTGVHSRVVRVRSEAGEVLTLPRANIEII